MLNHLNNNRMNCNIFNIGKIEICRCSQKDYFEYGFDRFHYLKGIGCGAMCYLAYVNDEVAAFLSILAMPIRGHGNCVIFHRIVVMEKWRGLGLGRFLTLLISGMLKNVGKEVYMKVQSKSMGKWQERERLLWEATPRNRRTRTLTKGDVERNKARYCKAAYSHHYIGVTLKGYEWLASPVQEIHKQGLMYKRVIVDVDKVLGEIYSMDSIFMRDCHVLSIDEVIQKYRYKFSYFTKTIEGNHANTLAIFKNDNVLRLKDMANASYSQRKRIAYLNAIFRRVMRGDMAIEHLIYCLLYDNVTYNWNLEIWTVILLCRKAFTVNPQRYRDVLLSKNSYHVNVEVAKERGLTPRQASNIIRGELTATRIRELHDPTKTDKENIRIFAENGLQISVRTLKRWRMTNGFTKYNSKSDIRNS